MTAGQIYLDAKDRVQAFARELSDEELATNVPSCPLWTVKEVLAHLAGAATDFVAGNATGGDDWTAKHVSDRNDATVDEMFAEWDGAAADVAPLVDADDGKFFMPLDVVTHEQDIRNAVAKPGERDNDGIDWGVQKAMGFVGGMLAKQEAPSLRVTAGDDEWLLGGKAEGDPAAEVDVDRYELFRTALGRRSEAQVRQWAWKGDPTPYLGGLSVFGLCDRDVSE